ncbi:CxC2 domain-containing protein [Mycena kentingensis (nom. inval.)]|nr:CxC2 domain-containing protein [Mycena kentingensis (nom. inval.)]
MSRGAKRRAEEAANLQANTTTFRRPPQPVRFTVTDGDGSHSLITPIVPRATSSVSTAAETPLTSTDETARAGATDSIDDSSPATPKRRVQLLEDFEENFEEISNILLEREAHPATSHPCPCGRLNQLADTTCNDCLAYSPSCAYCFVENHRRNPLHWAEVWDHRRGFFVRHDLSKLDVVLDSARPDRKGFVCQLGHSGGVCPSPDAVRLFTVMDVNGVHTLRIAYCGCREQPPNKVRQLLRDGLFPASTRDPLTAFTLNVLRQFNLHNLVSKKAAYDFVRAVQRLSDNAFAADVPNPYAAFLRTARVYNYLTVLKRTGQRHGIDALLTHRPPGNVLVWCPACPQPGFNSDPACPETPRDLRHLNQLQATLDGNFQTGQFSKNTDPDDVSLFKGKGNSPVDAEYKAYLARNPVSKEKSTCTYLTVVNKQDKKKFKNMSVTGTVNCQCSHVFIISSVDMHHGERFVNADMALARALESWAALGDETAPFTTAFRMEADDVDHVRTYDIALRLVHLVERIRWGIPALHVQGHQDSCSYRYGTAYMECVGHFHGESAEQYWPEANQLGPYVRQMNTGHRQDVLILHHGFWNWLKTVGLPAALAGNIALSRTNYANKRTHLIGLSISFRAYLSQWRKLPRDWKMDGKELTSPYKHNSQKVPSQRAIFQKLIRDDDTFARTPISKGKIANFMDEALKIQHEQRQLVALIADREEHDLISRQKEITNRTGKLQTRITVWRKLQREIMPTAGDAVAAQVQVPRQAHEEMLFLPSDFSEVERLALGGFEDLAAEEMRWREGEIFDYLGALQNNVKAIAALRTDKQKNDRQQKANTRSLNQIREGLRRRELIMTGYLRSRDAQISLTGSSRFPLLTDADLYMKPVLDKRRVGDSKLSDGALWTALAPAPLEEAYTPMDLDPTEPSVTDSVGTQMDHRHSAPRAKSRKEPAPGPSTAAQEARPSGWIWQLGKFTKMSDAEMDAWSQEGDRVQWFRAEAEMQRWREQEEQKTAELLRTRRSFLKMEEVWAALALGSSEPGHRAYALQKCAMYSRLAAETTRFITAAGLDGLLVEGASLVDWVRAKRAEDDKDFEKKINGS